MEQKKCSKCSQVKPLDKYNYHKCSSSKSGFKSACKSCRNNKFTPPSVNQEGNLYCFKCNKYKDKDEYWGNNRNSHRFLKGNWCKDCSRKNRKPQKKYIGDNLERHLKSRIRSAKENIRRKSEYRKESLGFDIDFQCLMKMYNDQRGLCAISNLPMTTKHGQGRIGTNVSIDRIDSSKGYTKDNIRLVRDHVNVMMSDMTDSEFFNYITYIVKHNKDAILL